MIKLGDIIEVNFKAHSALDVTDYTLMVEDSKGSRVAILNTLDINIIKRNEANQ